ncbi:MAG: hypothetical protein HZA95_00920 [Candidatus Vogelbacteria bacterium]|nr:hypothetical protein [Candidatus Vogelbacteria bacterium]
MSNKIIIVIAVVVVIILIAFGIVYTKSTDDTALPVQNSAGVAAPLSSEENELNTLDTEGDVDAELGPMDKEINSL